MQTNNLFSFQRFMLLCKQSLIINKKMIGITLVGFMGVLFTSLVFIQSKSNLSNWEIKNYMMFLYLFFIIPGIIYSSLSFPAFRSKGKSMSYLLLPSSSGEKYLFEFLSRIVLFIIVMPLLFWIIANLEGSIMHHFYPEFINYKFSFSEAYNRNSYNGENEWWTNFFIIQGLLFVFILSFAGASNFSKSPLLKTLFTFSIIVAGYSLLIYLLFKGFNLREYNPVDNRVLFIRVKDSEEVTSFFAAVLTLINLSFLAIAFFRLKEKEV